MPRPRSTRKTAAADRKTSTASRSSSSASTVEAVVLLDTYRWHDESNDPTTPVNEADKGEKIKVSAAEYKRGSTMTPPALAKTGSSEAKAVKSDEPPADQEPELTKPDQTPVDPDES